MQFGFSIDKKLSGTKARAGLIKTPHGVIETPAFIVVGTKATVKALTPEQVKDLGAQAVLGNTYHLYLEPGDRLVAKSGGVGKFMNWSGPTFTDSGGFQVFSLGEAFGKGGVSKVAKGVSGYSSLLQKTRIVADETETEEPVGKLAKIDEDGVTFKSYRDGSEHRFTPERSMEIQHNLGADIIFAFDECTSPQASHEYQKEALDRTHRWAKRSLDAHKGNKQALFGVVQGGRFKDLREDSALKLSKLPFDGFGIGGSFDKEDINTVVGWVNEILPEDKPRHLLGIGEPEDLFGGVEEGIDTFDCVTPTRIARNGTLYTKEGKINILNARFREDFSSVDKDCECYTCKNYTLAYLSHLFRSKEMLGATLASIHNLYFIVNLVANIRKSIVDGNFKELKENFLARYVK